MIRFPIETERLLLRPFQREDADELHAIWSDPASARFRDDAGPEPQRNDSERIDRSFETVGGQSPPTWGSAPPSRPLSWPRPRAVEDTLRYLEPIMAGQTERGYASWAVIEKATGRLIGDCGLFPADGVGPEIELAYGLAPDVWGRGYATEAAAACLRVGFEQLGVTRIVADVDPENRASIRVLEKAGFEPAGTEEGKLLYAATAG